MPASGAADGAGAAEEDVGGVAAGVGFVWAEELIASCAQAVRNNETANRMIGNFRIKIFKTEFSEMVAVALRLGMQRGEMQLLRKARRNSGEVA